MLVRGVGKAEAAEEGGGLWGDTTTESVLPDLAALGLTLYQLTAVVMRHSTCAVNLHRT